ncbi:siderophore esteras-like protein IroE-like protein [Lophiostoma macrostomum CBS 122681]|uniref:Siderophore esteras-like protein IroE-like protein n=1 Tax=Lophiostoma macrostomum CBS 122681 TaxID=1314788 RepID=A0A6A6SRG7_9PLEO|nr:siderophore esteras-like protein IroE-like protein [Lophiostoma macrostomum CBS 122681]
MSEIGTWSFNPLYTAFEYNVLPNVQFWNVTNGTWEYQVQLAYPLNWTSTDVQSTVETMYVLDGNALGLTATEAFRRRRTVELYGQVDCIVVSLGYPDLIEDSPYSTHRSYDYQPPVCDNCTLPAAPGVPSNAENFVEIIDTVIRPWVQNTIFPNVEFDRDAIYGHSFAGLFVIWALLAHPSLFDTFLTASPYLPWNNASILNDLGPLADGTLNTTATPAFEISYGALEQFPVKRRTETEEQFETRKAFEESMMMSTYCNQLYNTVKDSPILRDVTLHEYPFSDHAAVGAAALADGIDYFLD